MSQWWGHLKLKVLAFGIAMSVLPLAIYGWYGLNAARSAQLEIVRAQNEAAANAVATELAQFVRHITTQVELLARLDGGQLVTAPGPEQERVLYTLLRDIPYLEEVSLVDLLGNEVARASRREVVAGQEPTRYGGGQLWEGIRQGRSTMGSITFDLHGRPLFALGVPLPGGKGALVAQPTLRGLIDNTATVRANAAVRTHVLDGSGRLIGDSDYSFVLAGYRWEAPPLSELPYTSVTGDKAFGYLAQVPGLDWQVVAETTVDDAMGPVWRLAWEFAGGALLLMSVIVGLSIRFGLQLTEPLERLEAGTKRVGAGDFAVRVPQGGRDELGRLITAFNGMTEKLQTQDASLRAERDRLDTVVSAIGAGLALIDPEGRILWVNRRLSDWFPEAVPGARCWESLGRLHCQGTCCEGGSEHPVMIQGQRRLFRYHTYLLEGAGPGEPARLEVLEDVTEHRSMEQMVLQSEKLAAVGQLAAGVAHEINNPLAIISAYAEDLNDRLHEEGAVALEEAGALSSYLQQLQLQVQRCKGITTNLLDFARRGPAEPEPVELAAVAEATASLVMPRARKAGLEVAVEASTWLPPVRASRDQLQQVFLNLITNALDAMEEAGGSRVTVLIEPARTGADGEPAEPAFNSDQQVGRVERGDRVNRTEELGWVQRVRVGVLDDGPGMDLETQSRALEPFYTTKPPGKGTGLGLSMCYGILTGLGGRMWLESREGGGTGVWFELPVWEEERVS